MPDKLERRQRLEACLDASRVAAVTSSATEQAPESSEERGLQVLIEVVDLFRHCARDQVDDAMVELCELVEQSEERRAFLLQCICGVLCHVRLVPAFTESGITSDRGFLDELGQRISHRLLPELNPPQDLRTVIRQVFARHYDHEWLSLIGKLTWRRFFTALGASPRAVVCCEVISSIRILSLNVSSLGLAPDITSRLPELDELDSPFIRLSEESLSYVSALLGENDCNNAVDLDTLLQTLGKCKETVSTLRVRKQSLGTSLRLTSLSFRLLQQIARLEVLLHMTGPLRAASPQSSAKVIEGRREKRARVKEQAQQPELPAASSVGGEDAERSCAQSPLQARLARRPLSLEGEAQDIPVDDRFRDALTTLIRTLVNAENTRNSLKEHFKQSVDLMSYQVVEHAARRGTKYITATRKEYFAFLRASMGGGLIVAVFAVFKIFIDTFDLSLAADATLYSLNYALAFLLIQASGAVLATKQPAMTASAIARSMDGEGGSIDVPGLAELIVRVARSQFISFVGNLSTAFPLAILIAYLISLSGDPIASPEKAQYLLDSQHPWASGAAIYGGIAGVFLFMAGLVSGYFDNRNVYSRIAERLARHPLLLALFGEALSERIAALVKRNLGAVAGTIFLGFCLGSASTIGVFFGLPFDIRHIAFSSAHTGIGFHVLGYELPLAFALQTLLGVCIIGLMNFSVSFGLALMTALESRRVSYKDTRLLARTLLVRLLTRPWHFFFPPKDQPATPEEPDSDELQLVDSPQPMTRSAE
ncbi:MAG: hypothetical protein RBU37_16810 [Myxococcota bacterium]|jgi:site-specific recombinase|nr:hypothetical protein [Myxococcota bacterium]